MPHKNKFSHFMTDAWSTEFDARVACRIDHHANVYYDVNPSNYLCNVKYFYVDY